MKGQTKSPPTRPFVRSEGGLILRHVAGLGIAADGAARVVTAGHMEAARLCWKMDAGLLPLSAPNIERYTPKRWPGVDRLLGRGTLFAAMPGVATWNGHLSDVV